MKKHRDSLDWIKKLPSWISGAIGLTTAVIGFVKLLRGDYALGITILGILTVVSLFFLFLYLAFARTQPLIEGGRGVYRFEKYRLWAIAGLVFTFAIAASTLAFKPSRSFIITAFSGTDTPLSTRGITILVSEFTEDAHMDWSADRAITQAIIAELGKLNDRGLAVTVRSASGVLTDESIARQELISSRGDLMLFGWYTLEGSQTTVRMTLLIGPKVASRYLAKSHEGDEYLSLRLRARYPDDLPQLAHLIETLLRHGESAYEAAYQVADNPAAAHFFLSTVYWSAGDWGSTIQQLRATASLDPQLPLIHSNLGAAYANAGSLDKAVEEFEYAVAGYPAPESIPSSLEGVYLGIDAAYNNLGVVRLIEGKSDAAISHFNTALAANKLLAEAHNNLAVALIAESKPYDAIAQFETAVRLDPDSDEYLHNLVIAREDVAEDIRYTSVLDVLDKYSLRYVFISESPYIKGVFDESIDFWWPALGTITQGYWDMHRAIDIAGRHGTPVIASEDGVVVFVGLGDYDLAELWGNAVVIQHADGIQTWYLHLDTLSVEIGESVSRGEQIGTIGDTGAATGPVLTFVMRINGVLVNPRDYLP